MATKYGPLIGRSSFFLSPPSRRVGEGVLNRHGRQANGVAYGNGKFVAVGEAGVIYSSGDGVNWAENDNHTDIGWMNRVYFLD